MQEQELVLLRESKLTYQARSIKVFIPIGVWNKIDPVGGLTQKERKKEQRMRGLFS